MRLARPPVDVSPAGLARRVEEETLRELQLAMAIEERGGDGAVERSLTAALVAGEAALRAGTPWLAFAAGVRGGPPASSCTLFLDLDGRVALIDEVGTLRSCRGRGLARAVISAAARAAREHGCGEVFIAAELDDWPRLLYERMGFEAVGVQVSFALPAPPERLVASTG
jgi:GNAT superfamily N-acetyltransferase